MKMTTENDSTENRPRAAPVSGGERIAYVDVLRGFAVFGILLINIYGFSGLLLSPQSATDRLDRLVMIVMILLAQAKFYSLFSFLFGWGMSVQLERAVSRGANFVRLYLRRMLALLLIGVLHGILLWRGDILTTYAVLGMLLLLYRKSSPRKLLIWAGLFLLLAIVIVVPGNAMDQVRNAYEQISGFMRSGNMPPQNVFSYGSYLEITQRRMGEFFSAQSWFIYYLGNVFAMMLLGLYAGKRRILQDVEGRRSLIRKVMWFGLIIGLAFNAMSVWVTVDGSVVAPEHQRFARVATRTLGAPALMLFYASGLVLLMQRESWRQRLGPLAPVGRMALSNYLFQSVVASLLFYGYGLGLYGDITPTVALAMVVIIFLVQIRVSEWWMERFRFGPAEWFWRSLTYGRLQPLRREQPSFVSREPSRLASLSRRASGLNGKVVWVIVWILLIAWAGALYAWNSRLNAQSGGATFRLFNQDAPSLSSAAVPTATPVRPVAAEPEPEIAATPVVQPAVYRPVAAAASGDVAVITAAMDVQQVIDHIETLAGPEFGGRLTGSPGGWAAGEYIAEKFQEYGLQPAALNGTFFQSFPITYTTLTGIPQIEVTLPDGSPPKHYSLYEHFSPVVSGYAGDGEGSGPVHWLNSCRTEDFAGLDLIGKVVFCKPEPGNEALMTSSRLALEYGAAGLLLLANEEERPADFAGRYEELWVPETIPVLRVYSPLAEELLASSGLAIDELLRNDAPMALETQAALSVHTSDSIRVTSRNVLGVLPGRDPDYAHEVVVVGAHYDHMGEGPDGTLWAGANDNASGVSAVLEIARSWHELGYVPRRTVLFAAWDAEEWGLLGSRRYVERPSYPLEDTLASLQMDMVGAGPGALAISGRQELIEQQLDVAESLGVEAVSSTLGRSDHVPFLEAGVPASLLIWYSEDEPNTHYHRPADNPDVIEPDRVEAVLNVAGTTLLDLAESEPAIEQLVARRYAAAEEGQLSDFLATSYPDQTDMDSRWFADLQTLEPDSVEFSLQDIAFLGDLASANVGIQVTYGEEEERLAVTLPVQFTHTEDGWLWDGPALNWRQASAPSADPALPKTRATVGYPVDVETDQTSLAETVALLYSQVAGRLALSEEHDIQLMLLPDKEAIRFSSGLASGADRQVWVEPGLAQLIYTPPISQSQSLVDTMVQLVLADAGISEQSVPWLWHGLPIAWQAEQDLKQVHSQHLPLLTAAFAGDGSLPAATGSWAAVDYLIHEVGWEGLGQFIEDFGRACAIENCDEAAGVDRAMIIALEMDAGSFDAAWKEHWRLNLDQVQAGLDQLLADRTQALSEGNRVAFLATVDDADPYLANSEGVWFDRQTDSPVVDLEVTVQPVSLFPSGDILGEVTIEYQAPDAGEEQRNQVVQEVLFTLSDDGYKWAGNDAQTLTGDLVTIRYPDGDHQLAQDLLNEAERIYTELAGSLAVEEGQSVVVELYPNQESFRTAIGLAYPTTGWLPSWSEPGSGIKLQRQDGDSTDAYRTTLLYQLARNLLYQKGVTDEWLLKGVGVQVAISTGGRQLQRDLSTTLIDALANGPGFSEVDLLSIAPDEHLSGPAWLAETAYAWDSMMHLIISEGWPATLGFLDRSAGTPSIQDAFEETFGRSLAVFENEWHEFVEGGHASPQWTAAVSRLDGQAALEHVTFLGQDTLAGRQAGTAGAEIAAGYIAKRFAEYGLQPAGDMYGGSYFQSFPITFTERIGQPFLQVLDDPSPYSFRVDFLPAYAVLDSAAVQGELVWFGQSGDPSVELTGKIALVAPDSDARTMVDFAAANNAAGLLLLGFKRDELDLYAKQPLAPSILAEIPAVELTMDGSLRLLETLDQNFVSIRELPPGTPLETEVRLASGASIRENVRTTNVLGLLPGSDPLLSQQAIIIGAHYDHVGDDPPAICEAQDATCPPGARYSGLNDNASGVAVMLEIARLWHETGYQPKHSVIFAAWGAQEAGQLGSGHYVHHPSLPLANTIAAWQLDGLGGGEGFYPGLHAQPEADGVLSQAMNAAAVLLDQKIVAVESPGDSDHLSFRAQGFPSALVSWRLANENNLPDDLANGVSAERLAVSGRLVALTLMIMAR